ncbi:hypothetical protein EYF80_032969 [Liparis tanakae]|uniref:Uncharacterized protein n=1 Tax=Liparis tanakae TaxID=230148 RepID=A0A4Z2GTX6_9TELE|nr:hypothetical protein EYF80_032969 [Liparis tanakae]
MDSGMENERLGEEGRTLLQSLTFSPRSLNDTFAANFTAAAAVVWASRTARLKMLVVRVARWGGLHAGDSQRLISVLHSWPWKCGGGSRDSRGPEDWNSRSAGRSVSHPAASNLLCIQSGRRKGEMEGEGGEWQDRRGRWREESASEVAGSEGRGPVHKNFILFPEDRMFFCGFSCWEPERTTQSASLDSGPKGHSGMNLGVQRVFGQT